MTTKQAKAAPRLPQFTTLNYAQFFAAGALCCTVTHGMVTPIDVVKTRTQVDDAFKGQGMLRVARSIVAQEGTKGLLTGFGPTAVGYLVQGGAKFAGYEFFKLKFSEASGGYEGALRNRTAIYLGGAAVAEFIADIFLTPLEAVRIRLVSDRKYATGMASGLTRMMSEGGVGQLYAGFIPIVCKQVPYALGQFVVNEKAHEFVYKRMSEAERNNMSPAKAVAVNLGCGVTAGVAAAILSHPADTLLSRINKGQGGPGGAASKLIRLAAEAGPIGIWSGLPPRIAMTCILVSGQFLIYDAVKHLFNAPPGVDIHA